MNLFQDIADIRNRMDQENSERCAEDKALNDRLDKEISDREAACNQLQARYPNNSVKLLIRS